MRTTTGWMTLLVLLFVVAACVAASSVQASTSVRYGIQDDAWLEFGPGTLNQRLATFKRLGVPRRGRTVVVRRSTPRRDPETSAASRPPPPVATRGFATG